MPNVRSTHTDSCGFFGSTTPQALARQYGTPLYVYNEGILRARCRELKGLSTVSGFQVNYSAKANANLHLLEIVRSEGLVVDAMSPGEIHLNTIAGFTPDQILYVCNNAGSEELANAVRHGLLVSVDCLSQLETLGKVYQREGVAGGRAMLRLNPGVGAGHHQKVITAGKETKFGISPADIPQAFALLDAHNMRLVGINQHIGSLFMEPRGYVQAAEFLLEFVRSLPVERRSMLDVLDFGGGFGIPYHKYQGEARLDLAMLGGQLEALMRRFMADTGYAGRFLVEPGRYVMAECGLLLGQVHAVKTNGDTRYVGTDLGFNQLMRPVLYDSFHDMEIYREGGQPVPESAYTAQTIVGNICESGDILAKNRLLPPLCEGDVLGVLDAGAYGYVMSSTYNQRLRPAEVLIDTQGQPRLIRRRESLEDLMSGYADL